ncbi:MAG: MotA/TolQ/ExbB proton channel family protein [Polyangiales bacterium]
MIEALQRLALGGGKWVLYFMLALSMVSFAVMIERAIYFLRRRDDVDALGDRLIALLRKDDRRAADALLAASPSVEAKVLRRTLAWIDGGPGAVSQAMDAEMGRERRNLEKGSTFLGTLGNNAPFIGLLGTVLGVIEAFHELGAGGQNQGAMGNVMSGIAEALIATGVGLFVALPAVVAYNVTAKKIGDIEANVGIIGKQVLALLESETKARDEWRALGEPAPHEPGHANGGRTPSQQRIEPSHPHGNDRAPMDA